MNTPVDAKPPNTLDHLAGAVRFSPSEIKKAVGQVEGFNAKVAVFITSGVGTMACAYVFALIALFSLPAILIQAHVLNKSDVPNLLTKPGLILIVAWIAQTFLQLILLSIIMVGQSVQSAASDARAAKTFDDTEAILKAQAVALDRLDCRTEGGLQELLAAIEELKATKRATT